MSRDDALAAFVTMALVFIILCIAWHFDDIRVACRAAGGVTVNLTLCLRADTIHVAP